MTGAAWWTWNLDQRFKTTPQTLGPPHPNTTA